MNFGDIELMAPAKLPAPLKQAFTEYAEYARMRSECEQYLAEHEVLRQFLELTEQGDWTAVRQAFGIGDLPERSGHNRSME